MTMLTHFCLWIVTLLLTQNFVFSSDLRHTNNWAVLVCTSRYWFNYRHVANTLSVYRSVKRLGIPDSQIILMLADDMACNPRNKEQGTVFNNRAHQLNVYGTDIEVDYRGYEVTVENFIRVLTGRLPSSVPRSKRLLTDDRSNVLVYMTGHGGEGFLKFQDAEEITSEELGAAFEQMWKKRRYSSLMFLIDTCQAESLYRSFYSPNIIAAASSRVSEDSLSHHSDPAVGVSVIDRWTFYILEYLEHVRPNSKKTVEDLFSSLKPSQVISTPSVRRDLFPVPLNKVRITDFFGSVRKIDVTPALPGGGGDVMCASGSGAATATAATT
eukprot:scpid48102/ scgid24886/ GPI-anchor transamidase; GPI8 homolog; Phosphatidylinositol-glycan biosynthesis class K protein